MGKGFYFSLLAIFMICMLTLLLASCSSMKYSPGDIAPESPPHTQKSLTQHKALRIAQDLHALDLKGFYEPNMIQQLQGAQTLRTAYNGSNAKNLKWAQNSSHCVHSKDMSYKKLTPHSQPIIALHSVIYHDYQRLQRYAALLHTNNNLSCRAYSTWLRYSVRAIYSHRTHLPPQRRYCA